MASIIRMDGETPPRADSPEYGRYIAAKEREVAELERHFRRGGSERRLHLPGQHSQKRHAGAGGTGGGFQQFTSDEGYAWHEQHKEWAEGLSEDDADALKSYASFTYKDINAIERGEVVWTEERTSVTPELQAEWVHWMQNGGLPSNEPRGPEGEKLEGLPSSRGVTMHYRKRVPDLERMDRARETANRLNEVITERGIILDSPIEVNRATYLPGISPETLAMSVGQTLPERGFVSTMVGDAQGRAQGYIGINTVSSKLARGVDGDEVGSPVHVRIQLPEGTPVASVSAARRWGGRRPQPDRLTESELLLRSGSQLRIKEVRLNAGTSTDSSKTPYHEVVVEYVSD